MNCLVIGLGIITTGIINNLTKDPTTHIFIHSRRPLPYDASHEQIHVWDPTHDVGIDVIISCAEHVERAQAIWADSNLQLLFNQAHPPLCFELGTLSVAYIISWSHVVTSFGAAAIELPVTGSKNGANQGTLSLFAHISLPPTADTAYIDHYAATIFTAISSRVYRFTTVGEATQFKLMYNTWGALILYTLKLMLPYIKQDPLWFTIIQNDGWMAPLCSGKLQQVITHSFADVHFSLQHMAKDLQYFSAEQSIDDPILHQIITAYETLAQGHSGSLDFSAIATER